MPWIVAERIMQFSDTTSKLHLNSTCKIFRSLFNKSQVWQEIEWHHEIFPKNLVKVVQQSGNQIKKFICGSKREGETNSPLILTKP